MKTRVKPKDIDVMDIQGNMGNIVGTANFYVHKYPGWKRIMNQVYIADDTVGEDLLIGA